VAAWCDRSSAGLNDGNATEKSTGTRRKAGSPNAAGFWTLAHDQIDEAAADKQHGSQPTIGALGYRLSSRAAGSQLVTPTPAGAWPGDRRSPWQALVLGAERTMD